jgi:glycosyltransferase involved in cell wall biosynthesis
LVDPRKPQEIAEAIRWLLNHSDEAEVMGRKGMHAVTYNHNWAGEAERLCRFYERILGEDMA